MKNANINTNPYTCPFNLISDKLGFAANVSVLFDADGLPMTYTLLKGSVVRSVTDATATCPKAVVAARLALTAKDITTKNVLRKDFVFTSPSTLCAFVAVRSINGRTALKLVVADKTAYTNGSPVSFRNVLARQADDVLNTVKTAVVDVTPPTDLTPPADDKNVTTDVKTDVTKTATK